MKLWKLKLLSVGLLLVLWTNVNPPEKTYAANISYQSTSSVATYVSEQAKIHGVDPKVALFIVQHESQFCIRQTGDDGNSRGCWQISRIWHPEVSDKCAFDLKCSTNWSLQWIKSGHVNQWSTYRLCKKLYGICPY